MWVDPAARGRGVGRALLDAVDRWGAGWGAREVVLWVFESNRAAMRLYETSGFEHITSGPDAEAGVAWQALAMRRLVGPAKSPARRGIEARSRSTKR
jgi:ribosomal protein S18 acetylase RimI-like enzyme